MKKKKKGDWVGVKKKTFMIPMRFVLMNTFSYVGMSVGGLYGTRHNEVMAKFSILILRPKGIRMDSSTIKE